MKVEAKFKIGQPVKKSAPSLDDRKFIVNHVSYDVMEQAYFYTVTDGVNDIAMSGFYCDFEAV